MLVIKLNIHYNNEPSSHHGEFIQPNIIIVYKYQCQKDNRNIKNVLLHEKIHYLIYKIKPLRFIFNKLTTYVTKKYKNESVDFVYSKLPEEIVCNFIANTIHKRYFKGRK